MKDKTDSVGKDHDESPDEGAPQAPRPARNRLLEAVTDLAKPIAESFGVELDRVEMRQAGRRTVLQVFIDKPGGVTHEDCARVSRQLSAELDVHDFIPVAYDLEVSSPGLDRPLSGEADFRRFAGRPAALTLRRAIPGAGSKIVGTLEGVEDGGVLVRTRGGETLRIPLEQVAKARLEPEI